MTRPELQPIICELEKEQEPALVYDRAGIKGDLDLLLLHLRRAVRDRLSVVVLFSVKANPNLQLLKWFGEQGVGAETSSMAEYEMARRAGMPQISATSPGLTARNVSDLLVQGVRVNIDNPTQLQSVPPGAEIGLRLRLPLDLLSDSPASVHSRFGLIPDDPALREALRSSKAKVVRLHGHFRDIGNAAQLTALAGRLVAATSSFPEVSEINLGGGMTRLYKNHAAAAEAWDQCTPIFNDFNSGTRLFVEPGAQLLTKHGYLGTRVVSVTSRPDGRKLIVVDSSKWNLVCWSEYELVFPEPTTESAPADVVGPTCYEKDVWATGLRLPEVTAGQQLIFRGLGSYVTSMARRMHALPLPKEILL
jgi:diaminopimelate decarboxylase